MSGGRTRFGEITVDSDFVTTALLVVLFIILSLMLMRDVRHILWGTQSLIAIRGPLNRLATAFAIVYCLVFVFRWPNGLVKIGCALFAAHFSLALASTYLSISATARPALAIADSIVMQISLATFLIAIAHWFRTVVRWDPPSRGERDDR
jgi:hypothetical protein